MREISKFVKFSGYKIFGLNFKTGKDFPNFKCIENYSKFKYKLIIFIIYKCLICSNNKISTIQSKLNHNLLLSTVLTGTVFVVITLLISSISAFKFSIFLLYFCIATFVLLYS